MRAMALRISVGRSKATSVSVAFGVEGEAHVGEGQALEVEGAHGAGIAPVRFGAHEPDIELPARILDAGNREGRRALRFEDGHPLTRPAIGAKPSMKPCPSTPATPSLIQTMLASGVDSRKRLTDSR